MSLPEHLNSFRLIGTDKLTAGSIKVAQRLLAAQKWLDRNTRDIIDALHGFQDDQDEIVIAGESAGGGTVVEVLESIAIHRRKRSDAHPTV